MSTSLMVTRKLPLLAEELPCRGFAFLFKKNYIFFKATYVRILASSSIMSRLCFAEFLKACYYSHRCFLSFSILQAFKLRVPPSGTVGILNIKMGIAHELSNNGVFLFIFKQIFYIWDKERQRLMVKMIYILFDYIHMVLWLHCRIFSLFFSFFIYF